MSRTMIALAIIAVAMICFALATAQGQPLLPAHPHGPIDWRYDANCCQYTAEDGGDCQAIPASSVRIVEDGYQITLKSGDHALVTEPHTWVRRWSEVRWSQDENYHACLWPDEETLRCFYAIPQGS